MEEQPGIDLVISAISTLYHNPDKSEKERASQWLLELQKSVSSFKILGLLTLHYNFMF